MGLGACIVYVSCVSLSTMVEDDIHFSYQLSTLALLFIGLLLLILLDVLFEARIPLSDDALDGCEFARSLLDAHAELV